MLSSLFPGFWAAAWFGVLFSAAGLLWAAARRKPGGGFAVFSVLYGCGVVCALLPEGLHRTSWSFISQCVSALYKTLAAERWYAGGCAISFGSVLCGCWIMVSCGLLAWYFASYFRAAYGIRKYAVPAGGRTQLLLQRLTQEKRRLPVSAFVLPGLDSPCGFGLLRRKILLPEIPYTEEELVCVLRHEYTHFLRHDVLRRQLTLLLCAAYWWSPAVWVLQAELEQAADLRCDAASTRHMDKSGRTTYLRAMVRTLQTGGQGYGLRERFAAVISGSQGERCNTERGGGKMIKRSWLYITRKYKRSILLLLLLFMISSGISIGLCVWGSIGEVTREVEQTFGTGFRLKVPSFFRSNPDYGKEVVGADGKKTLQYAGPKLDDTIIEEIRKLDGVTRYNAELDQIILLEEGKLFPGLFSSCIEGIRLGQIASNERQNIESLGISSRTAMAYGYTDTSLADHFRTGSFSLTEGRHITEQDQWKVLISDKAAEINGWRTGDSITICNRNALGGYPDPMGLNGEIKQLEIVGIFHVNGFQPETEWVAEIDSTYNYLITDMTTALYFDQVGAIKQYGSPRADVLYENLTFFVDDPARLGEVMREVKALDTIDVSRLDFSTDDTMYKSTVKPLNTIRNLVVGSVAVIVLGCAAVLCIVFTMWVRSRRQEIAVYLSMGFGKAVIIGQFLLEAAMVALAAGVLSLAACQKAPDMIGNFLLSAAIEEAQPVEREITREEIHEAVQAGAVDQLYHYESGDYGGPEHIDFTFRTADFLLLLLFELLIITGAVCKGSSFVFFLQPRQIMTDFR